MDLEDEVKWGTVQTTSREILYYCNKITGQQKWTNKNCYCSKPKDPLKPTTPCCYKKCSASVNPMEKGLMGQGHVIPENHRLNVLSSRKLYCLSDIVSEVRKSLFTRRPKCYKYKGHRKRKRRKNNSMGFKNDTCARNDDKNDVNTSENSKKNISAINETKNDLGLDEDSKSDVTAPEISISDIISAENCKDNGISDMQDKDSSKMEEKVTENDVVRATRDSENDITRTNVISAENCQENGSSDMQDKDSSEMEEKVTDNLSVTKNSENDGSPTDNSNSDVVAAKDSPKDDVISGIQNKNSSSSKMEEKVITNKRILKRKREASDIINCYKAKLRIRRKKIEIASRRKYRRRNPLKSVEADQTKAAKDISNDSLKKNEIGLDNKESNKVLDPIEESILEIVQLTSGYSIEDKIPCTGLGSSSEPGSFEKQPGKPCTNLMSSVKSPTFEPSTPQKTHALQEVIQPQFVDEEFIQMNKIIQASSKENKKTKILGAVERKNSVLKTKSRNFFTVVSSKSTQNLPDIGQKSGYPALHRSEKVHSATQSPSSLTSLSTADNLSIPTKPLIVKTELLGRDSEHLLWDGKTISNYTTDEKNIFSSGGANTNKTSPSFSKHNLSPNRKQSRKSLDKIVKSLKSRNKAAVPLESTVSKTRWSLIVSKEAKKIRKTSDNEESIDVSSNSASLSPEQVERKTGSPDTGTNCSEFKSPASGQTENALSLAGMPEIPSVQSNSLANAGFNSDGVPSVDPTRKTKSDSRVGISMTTVKSVPQTPELTRNVTEVPASYVDLSWRIVTSNDGNSASLSNFFKLVPIVVARGSGRKVDNHEPRSFLGVPIHSGPQVIAKILNTSVAYNCNEIFRIKRTPTVSTSGVFTKRMTLSFLWDDDAVLVESDAPKAGSLSGKGVNPRSPVWMDSTNKVSIVLPKPLRLPVAGNIIYLGDFNVKTNHVVEFVVTHSVVVTTSPRPSLTIPSGTPMNSTSTLCQTIRCRSPGEARHDVEATRVAPVSKKQPKDDEKLFLKCVFCGAPLRCRKDVKLHRRLHVSFGGTKCSECKRRFLNGGRLSIHINNHKCHWHHTCRKCYKPYRTPKFLTPVDLAKDYYKMCFSCRRKELKCKKCAERCMTYEDLEVHFREKHGFKCPICRSTSLSKRDLSKHMKSQHRIGLPPSANSSAVQISSLT